MALSRLVTSARRGGGEEEEEEEGQHFVFDVRTHISLVICVSCDRAISWWCARLLFRLHSHDTARHETARWKRYQVK